MSALPPPPPVAVVWQHATALLEEQGATLPSDVAVRTGQTSTDSAGETIYRLMPDGHGTYDVTIAPGLTTPTRDFVILHEAVHVTQRSRLFGMPKYWLEGQADATAADLYCPLQARIYGRTMAIADGCASWMEITGRNVSWYRRQSALACSCSWRSSPARRVRLGWLR